MSEAFIPSVRHTTSNGDVLLPQSMFSTDFILPNGSICGNVDFQLSLHVLELIRLLKPFFNLQHSPFVFCKCGPSGFGMTWGV